jgi:hypothetical protein
MANYGCEEGRHIWQTTTAPGWFRCHEVVGSKTVKRGRLSDLQLIYCSAVAYCPGCLGYCLDGYSKVLCQAHVTVNVESLPLVTCRSSSRPSRSAPCEKQKSLW